MKDVQCVPCEEIKVPKIVSSKKRLEGQTMHEIITRILREENIMLCKKIAHVYKFNEEYLLEKYIKPEYYTPIVDKS